MISKRKDTLFQLATFLFLLTIIPLTVVILRRETDLSKKAKEIKVELPKSAETILDKKDVETKTLFPQSGSVGWVVSSEPATNHFVGSDIHVGHWEGNVYAGVIQFDLSEIPQGAKVLSAQTAMIGKSRSRMGEGGIWKLNLLDSLVDPNFKNLGFEQISQTKVLTQILPELVNSDLAVYKENAFIFSEEQLKFLEERISTTQKITFRLDGPVPNSYPFNLFTWESGYGEEGFKIKPVLEITYEIKN